MVKTKKPSKNPPPDEIKKLNITVITLVISAVVIIVLIALFFMFKTTPQKENVNESISSVSDTIGPDLIVESVNLDKLKTYADTGNVSLYTITVRIKNIGSEAPRGKTSWHL